MMISYRVFDLDGGFHGTYEQLKDAEKQAQTMANILAKDIYIEETKIEIVKCITPK
jgi:hypothetical protein